VRAIGLSREWRLFSQPIVLKGRDPDPNFVVYKSAEILGLKEPDGTVKVVFSRPTSEVMVTAGRKATAKLLEVNFTKTGVISRSIESAGKDNRQPVNADAREARFCKAIIAVCARLRNGDKSEFAVGVAEDKNSRKHKLTVMVERVPYTPGGHTLYIMSNDMKVAEIAPGA
jgi:hypothetical protein